MFYDLEEFDPRLHEAVRDGKVEEVRNLIKEGLNINANDDELHSRTPLEMAITQNREEIAKILLRAGANVNLKNFLNRNNTPLQSALNKSDLNMAKMLVNAGADVNTKCSRNGHTVLHLASSKGNVKAIKNLVIKGANANLQNNNGHTPLQLVPRHKFLHIGRILVNAGADANYKTIAWPQETLLHLAVIKNDTAMIEYLLSLDVDVNVSDQNNITPLQLACVSTTHGDCHKKIIVSLLKNGADVGKIEYKNNFNYRFSKKALKILLQYSDSNMLDSMEKKIFNSYKDTWQSFLAHLAKLEALEISLNPGIFKTITENQNCSNYFDECKKELSLAKDIKLKNSWITFFHVLTSNKRQLKNYAGNEDLVDDFEKSNSEKKFPIYGLSMAENIKKGIKRRGLFDKSADLLANCLPIYNPTHLIIKDVLDCTGTKDLSNFCK